MLSARDSAALLGSLPRKNTCISIDMEREPLMPPGSGFGRDTSSVPPLPQTRKER
jgi:hypothetical protein